MNPKKEFVKAIMALLRLENNVYIVAGIEEVIDKLDQDDYITFIAYLGERDSEYERPIESVTKAVDEYYNIKLEPYKEEANIIFDKLRGAYYKVDAMVTSNIDKYITKEEIEKLKEQAKIDYGEQGEQAVETTFNRDKYYLKKERESEKMSEITAKDPRDDFFKGIKSTKDGSSIYTDEMLKVAEYCGTIFPEKNKVYEYYLKGKIRFSIVEKIKMKETDIEPKIDGIIKKMIMLPRLPDGTKLWM